MYNWILQNSESAALTDLLRQIFPQVRGLVFWVRRSCCISWICPLDYFRHDLNNFTLLRYMLVPSIGKKVPPPPRYTLSVTQFDITIKCGMHVFSVVATDFPVEHLDCYCVRKCRRHYFKGDAKATGQYTFHIPHTPFFSILPLCYLVC